MALGCLLAAAGLASCGSDDAPSGEDSDVTVPASGVTADDCIIRLHGKGGSGAPTVITGGIADVSPDGNSDGWGGREWRYFPDDRLAEARAVVTEAIDDTGCERVVINGFSNGGAFAAALACDGQRLDARVVGIVIDDPVPDNAVDGCVRPDDVDVRLYWTGALDSTATPGADCAPIDWTCAGGTLIGISAYAEQLGVEVTPSPLRDHEWYRGAPELRDWLG